MKSADITIPVFKIISIKTKGCIIQVFNAARAGANSNERIIFVRNMADDVYRCFNNFLQIKNELFPVKITEFKANKAMSYTPVTLNGVIPQDCQQGSGYHIKYQSQGLNK